MVRRKQEVSGFVRSIADMLDKSAVASIKTGVSEGNVLIAEKDLKGLSALHKKILEDTTVISQVLFFIRYGMLNEAEDLLVASFPDLWRD